MGARADEVRFADLWDRYAPRVLAYASRHVGVDEAQDVVAETFLVAWRRLADVPGFALPWLLVVARNTIGVRRRSLYRRRMLDQELQRLDAYVVASDSAEAIAVSREALVQGLRRLSPREREALLLVAWDGLTLEQGAQVVGCSVSAFTMRLSRARARLREASRSSTDPPGREAERDGAAPREAATTTGRRGS